MGSAVSKNKNAKKAAPKAPTGAPKPATPQTEPVPAPAAASPDAPQDAPRELQRRTIIGALDYGLLERLILPALEVYGQRHDDDPLRHLVESIVNAIAMRDAYSGYRKLDDVCQRYLYYRESLRGASVRSREAVELGALCDYWRLQFLILLIRDSSAIFSLLLPEPQPKPPQSRCLPQDEFLDSVRTILNGRIDSTIPVDRESCGFPNLYGFAFGESLPWPGFATDAVFPLQHTISDGEIRTASSLAMASAPQTAALRDDVHRAIHRCLFTDLVFAQHRRVYEDICTAFSGDEIIPDALADQTRVRFDKTYQNAYDAMLAGVPIAKALHRSSRLDAAQLTTFGTFASVIEAAANRGLGLYLFHYVG